MDRGAWYWQQRNKNRKNSTMSVSPVAQLVKNLPVMRIDLGLIPELGRSPGEGDGYPLQYSGLENSMDCIVHGGHKESDRTEQLSLSLR